MANESADPCAQQRAALNDAQQELAAHREAYGESDVAQEAAWGEERRRLTEAAAAAIAAYEDCVRANDPTLQGTVRPGPTFDPSSVPGEPPSAGPLSSEPLSEQRPYETVPGVVRSGAAVPGVPAADAALIGVAASDATGSGALVPDAGMDDSVGSGRHATADPLLAEVVSESPVAPPLAVPASGSAVSETSLSETSLWGTSDYGTSASEAAFAEGALAAAAPVGYPLSDGPEPGGLAAGVPRSGAPQWLRDALLKLEVHPAADKARLAIRDSAILRRVPEPVWSALRGDRFGHAVHPPLTDVPLGCWIGATVLDATKLKRMRPAATALVAVGVATAAPTAWTGVAEWREADARSQRVGVAHAALNSAATLCYGASVVFRLSGRHRRGVGAALLGGCLATVGGYLGGHLSITRHVGSSDPTTTG